MWCIQCQEDVPALPASDKRGLCCPRCGTTLCAGSTKTELPPPAFDTWEFDEQLRQIQRALDAATLDDDAVNQLYKQELPRFELPHPMPSAWHVPATPQKQEETKPARQGLLVSIVAWMALCCGTASFVCGSALLVWSFSTGRAELWTFGLPAALVGQVAILIGLLLQLDRLWRENRSATAKLQNVDQQLLDLKNDTQRLATSHQPAASVIRSHLFDDAGSNSLSDILQPREASPRTDWL